jgi:hypothetical protein
MTAKIDFTVKKEEQLTFKDLRINEYFVLRDRLSRGIFRKMDSANATILLPI